MALADAMHLIRPSSNRFGMGPCHDALEEALPHEYSTRREAKFINQRILTFNLHKKSETNTRV
jgi:hypothetical protein